MWPGMWDASDSFPVSSLGPCGKLQAVAAASLAAMHPSILLGVRSFFLVSVSHLDQAVKSARAFIPNQVPQSNIGATQ